MANSEEYTRGPRKQFAARGIDLSTPPDVQKSAGTFPILLNVIMYQDGVIETRPSLVDRYGSYAPWGGRSPVHSIRRLNDPTTGTWALVYGVGDGLGIERSSGVGTLVLVETGYDGLPLSIVTYRPPNAPAPFAYIANGNKQRKINTALATTKQIGIQRPNHKPIVYPDTGAFTTIDLFETNVGWATVTAGAVVGAAASRVNTTISGLTTEISGSSGICVIAPVSMANIGEGTILTITNGLGTEDLLVTQVNRAGVATTIKAILYDDENVAYATLTIPGREAQTNSLIFNSTRNQYARIRAVIIGPDETVSLEFKPPATTWSATDSVQVVGSFVVHPTLSPLSPGGVVSNYVPLTTAATGESNFDKTISIDLSKLSGYGTVTGATLDDYIHIAFNIDLPDKVTEIKVYLDIDATTNDFTRNYYMYSVSPSDFTPVTKSTQSALDNRALQINRRSLDSFDNKGAFSSLLDNLGNPVDRIDDPAGGIISPPADTPGEPSRDQLTPGDNQYSEIDFPFASMTKVGADVTRGPKDVKAIRIKFITTAVVTAKVDSWVLHGGYPPDVLPGEVGYSYAYRFRDSTTGAASDLSPAARGPIFPRRQRVSITPDITGAPTEVDKIDVFKIGGSIDTMSYLGTTARGGTFADIISDDAAKASESVLEAETGFDPNDPDFQPFPVIDAPKSGNTTIVAGTMISSGAQFDVRWAPGTAIIVGGTPTTIYRVIDSSHMEVEDNLNGSAGASWEISQPIILGQPLSVWGNDTFHGHALATGDLRNPGLVYYTKPKNLDATGLGYRIEMCGGSEVVQNIFVWADRAGVFTNKRLFYLEYDALNPEGILQPHESVNTKGLLSRWAMAVGRRGVAWLASDGIYMFGGEESITNLVTNDLKPLFSFGGRTPAATTNGITAPYIPNPIGAEEKFLRLAFIGEDEALVFFYRDSIGNAKAIRYDFHAKGWIPWVFGVQDAGAGNTRASQAVIGYVEEGAGVSGSTIVGTADVAGGRVQTLGGPAETGADAGHPFACAVGTFADDCGDPRAEKQFGDIELDLDPGGANVTITPTVNSYRTNLTPVVLSGTRANPPFVLDLTSGPADVMARDIAVQAAWTNDTGQRVKLYHWQPSYITHPENSLLRATRREFSPTGMTYVRGFWITADTGGATRTVTVDYTDHAGAAQTFVIAGVLHPTQSRIFYPIASPLYMTTWRFRPTDANKWRFVTAEVVGDPAPPYSTQPTEWTDDSEIGNKFLQGVEFDVDTHGNAVQIQIQGDQGVALGPPFTVNANQRNQIPFPFIPGVYTHLMRAVPLGNAHLFAVKYFWQTDAEVSAYFETQDLTFDIRGFGHMREAWIAYRGAASPVNLILYADGVQIAGIPALPASGAAYTKQRVMIPAKQWKSLKGYLTSATSFYCYKRDCEFWIKQWGATGDYEIVQPFGFISRDKGVAVI